MRKYQMSNFHTHASADCASQFVWLTTKLRKAPRSLRYGKCTLIIVHFYSLYFLCEGVARNCCKIQLLLFVVLSVYVFQNKGIYQIKSLSPHSTVFIPWQNKSKYRERERLTFRCAHRTRLSQYRSGFSKYINSFCAKINPLIQDICPMCSGSPHDSPLFMSSGDQTHRTVEDLWEETHGAAEFLQLLTSKEAIVYEWS